MFFYCEKMSKICSSRQKSDKNAEMFPQTVPMKESEVRSSVAQMLHCLKNDEDW